MSEDASFKVMAGAKMGCWGALAYSGPCWAKPRPKCTPSAEQCLNMPLLKVRGNGREEGVGP